MCSKSVKIGVMDLGLELARRGHRITVVSPFKSKKETENVTEIINKSELEALTEKVNENELVRRGSGLHIQTFVDVSYQNNRHALSHPEVVKLLEEDDIDVVVVVPVFVSEVGYYLAHKKEASIVTVMTVPFSFPHINWAIGDIYNPSFMPIVVTGFSQSMTFLQRFTNTVVTAAMYLMMELYARPKADSLIAEVFPDDLDKPSTSSLSREIALYINHGSPFLGDGMRPTGPKTVFAGLMTCAPPKPLPEDLNYFVESADDGVIFISFGSVIKASKMPEEKRKMFLSAFSKLKQKIIWKWETEMPDAPPNVFTSSWLPQQDLLGHPNVKLFITHGGAGSYQETICHSTPVVGIPVAVDQYVNLNEAVRQGIGLLVDWHEVTEEKLLEAVKEVLDHSKYNDAVVKLNSLLLDQPLPSLERAVWWMEYLLRHPGNKDMRSPVKDLWWFQYLLLDVVLVLLVITFTVLFILRVLVCYCLRRCKSKSKDKSE